MTEERTQEWRVQMGARILEECDRAARALGAKGVVMIAMFEEDVEDGKAVHCVDAGRAPWTLEEVYQRMAMAHHMSEVSTRGTVQ